MLDRATSVRRRSSSTSSTHTDHRGALESRLSARPSKRSGKLGGDADSVAALKKVLYRGEWWAPVRTARLRAAAAAALRACGSPAAQQALEEAAGDGPRGVRRAAQSRLERAGAARAATEDQLMDSWTPAHCRRRRPAFCRGGPQRAALRAGPPARPPLARGALREAVAQLRRRPAVGGDRPHRPGDRRRRHAAAARPRKTTAS